MFDRTHDLLHRREPVPMRAIAYVAIVQFAFSALDVFARMLLRGSHDFLHALARPWFAAWMAAQLVLIPFQVRMIVNTGLGRSVALMSAFSVLYAVLGGYVIARELPTAGSLIAAICVIAATWLFATRGRQVDASPESASAGAAGAAAEATTVVAAPSQPLSDASFVNASPVGSSHVVAAAVATTLAPTADPALLIGAAIPGAKS